MIPAIGCRRRSANSALRVGRHVPRAVLLTLMLVAASVARGDDGRRGTVAFLGIAAKPADAATAAAAGLPEGLGLTVTFVEPNGPAGDAVRVGDVLQKLDDQLLVNAPQMVALVRLHRPGEAVTLTVVRNGTPTEIRVKLGSRPQPVKPAAPTDAGGPIPTLPGVAGPDPATGRIPDDYRLPLLGNTRTTVTYSDEAYSARVTSDSAGHRRLTVTTPAGKPVTAGPLDTAADWAKFPPDVRQHLQAVHDLLADTTGGGSATRP